MLKNKEVSKGYNIIDNPSVLISKLRGAVLLTSSVIFIIFSITHYYLGLQSLEKMALQSAQNISQRLAVSLRHSLYELDESAALDLLKAEFSNSDIIQIKVLLPNSKVFVSSTNLNNKKNNVAVDSSEIFTVSNVITMKVDGSEEVLGTLLVSLSIENQKANLLYLMGFVLMEFALLLFVVIIVLAWLLKKKVEDPLEHFEKNINKLTFEKFNPNLVNNLFLQDIPQKGATSNQTLTENFNAILNALNSREEILTKLILSMPDIVIRTDQKGRITFINDIGKLIYDLKSTEVKLTLFARSKTLTADYVALSVDNPLKKTIAPQEHFISFKGKELPYEVSISAIMGEDGKSNGYVFVLRDISTRKRIEQELVSAKTRAEEMTKVKSSFLANMSHEFRTPLNGIIGFSEILSDHDDSDVVDCSKRIFKSGQRLLETLDLILNVSRIEAGKVSVVQSQVNVNNILRRLSDIYSSIAIEKGIKYHLALPSSDIILISDENLIYHLCSNIISNAIKFTNRGEVIVTLQVILAEEFGTITISDTGLGISSSHIEQIWGAFRQAHEGFDRPFEGSGVGLFIVKKFCEAIDWKVSVESKLNEGTKFIVAFPKAQIQNS